MFEKVLDCVRAITYDLGIKSVFVEKIIIIDEFKKKYILTRMTLGHQNDIWTFISWVIQDSICQYIVYMIDQVIGSLEGRFEQCK